MATPSAGTGSVPSPSGNIDADPLSTRLNNLYAFLNEASNLDEANVDLSGTDGLVGKSTAQTITGLKTFENTAVAGGGIREVMQFGLDPVSGTPADADGGRLVFYADDDGGTETDIARLDWVFVDTGAASEDSRIDLYTTAAGTIGSVAELGYDASGNTVNTIQTREVIAAAVRDALTLEWDPDGDGNATDNSTGVGLAFKMPDSGDAQDVFARLSVYCVDDTATEEDAMLSIGLVTAGTVQQSVQITDGTMSFRGAATIDTSGNNALTLNAGTAALTVTAGDVTVYDDNNNADTSLSIGTSVTEALVISVLNGAANKTAEEIKFTSKSASATADIGKFTFSVDEADVLSIDDGGISLNGALAIDTGGNNNLTLNAGISDILTTASNLAPTTDNGAALGIADTNDWSDIFLASGAVINFENGDVTLTHSLNTLTIAGGDLVVPSLTSGGVIVSDTDSTDNLGTTSVRWANVYTDSLGDSGQDLTSKANNFIPENDGDQNLGSATKRWATMFLDYLGDNGQALPITPTVTIDLPDEVNAAEGAHRIIAVDLDDERYMWDLAKFRQMSRNTSWYAADGHMPTKLLMFIDDSEDSIHVYDRTDMSEWKTFAVAGSSLRFLDGRLYVGTTASVNCYDFVADVTYKWNTSGISSTGSGGIYGATFTLLNASPAIVNNTVNAVAVIRDPEGSIEADTGRPQHIVAVGTDGGLSVSNAGISAIYDHVTNGADRAFGLISGDLFAAQNEVGADYLNWYYALQVISADGFSQQTWWLNSKTGSEKLPWSGSETISSVAAIPNASVVDGVSPVVIFGSDEGLAISHSKRDDNTDGLTFIVNAVANWPPYSGSGSKMYSLALENATELFGRTVTNTNAVTFVAGVVGSGANFVAASSQSLSLADHADLTFTTAFSVGCWFKRDIDSGAIEGLVSKWDNGAAADQSFQLSIGATDLPTFKTATAGPAVITSVGPAISLATWYHLVGTYDGTTQKLYLNGELVDSDAQTGNMIDSVEKLFVGAGSATDAATQFFDGIIDDVFIMDRVLSAAEIRFLYQRGLSAMQSSVNANDALDSAVITAVAVSPDGEYIAVVVNGAQVVILDRYGIPILEDTGTTIDDVAVWRDEGCDDPSYAIGNAASIEVVQSNPRVLDRA